jgi:hypothetical protein
MPDYTESKIYKIVNDINDKVYYGSTTQKYLSSRMSSHRAKDNKCNSALLGVDWSHCKIILVEKINCKSKDELQKRERYYVENFDCVNKQIPNRGKKEYYETNREYFKNNMKKNYNKNKNYLREKIKCECGATVSRACLTKHKKTKIHSNWLSSCNASHDL